MILQEEAVAGGVSGVLQVAPRLATHLDHGAGGALADQVGGDEAGGAVDLKCGRWWIIFIPR